MNKDDYISAMDKIKTSEQLKKNIVSKMQSKQSKVSSFSFFSKSSFNTRKIVAICSVLIMILSIGLVWREFALKEISNEFNIIQEDTNYQGEYLSVIYIDDFEYRPIGWFDYSYISTIDNVNEVKGDKIGDVSLDLKGKTYTGTPPDFSSTLDVGTQVYQMRDVRKERAVLIIDRFGNASIFHRYRKGNVEEPISLIVSGVIDMIAESPKIVSVELRSEESGSLMRTSFNEELISIFNSEIPEAIIKNIHGSNMLNTKRVPINLVFEDGAMLHMQVFPQENIATIFGGYVSISTELSSAVQVLQLEGPKHKSIIDLTPYKQTDVEYLFITDYKDRVEILCQDPRWSRVALYGMLGFYRAEEADKELVGDLVVSIGIGKNSEDSLTIDFYEGEGQKIFFKLNNKIYSISNGQLRYNELKNYIENSTRIN